MPEVAQEEEESPCYDYAMFLYLPCSGEANFVLSSIENDSYRVSI